MFSSKNIALIIISTVAICLLAVQASAAGPISEGTMLEGAWVARMISLNGDDEVYPYQWSYVLFPGPSGISASVHGSIEVAWQTPEDLAPDIISPMIGEIVMTGPSTAAFNSYYYWTKKVTVDGIVSYQLSLITRVYGTIEFIGPDESEVTHNFELFYPEDDLDGDGFPDSDKEPFETITATSRDTRVPSPVECVDGDSDSSQEERNSSRRDRRCLP